MIYGQWYIVNIGVIRCSLLLLIRHIFGEVSPAMRRISTAGIVFLVLFTIAQVCVFAFQCTNPKATFDLDLRVNALCTKALLEIQALTAIGIGADFFILILPVYSIWNLKLPMIQRMKIMILFWLGVFTCIASTFRYISYEAVYKTNDIGCKYK